MVRRTVLLSSSSVGLALGRVKDASIACGVRSSSGAAAFLRLLGESGWASPSALFFDTRFAALRICLAVFSSGNIAWRDLRSVPASEDGLSS